MKKNKDFSNDWELEIYPEWWEGFTSDYSPDEYVTFERATYGFGAPVYPIVFHCGFRPIGNVTELIGTPDCMKLIDFLWLADKEGFMVTEGAGMRIED